MKKNGKTRLVIDYRKLNKLKIHESHLFTQIWDEIQSLTGSELFSQLDLNIGYYQILVKPSERYNTAFVTHKGHYEFNRMPFGLTSAPRIFQRAMINILGHLYFVNLS